MTFHAPKVSDLIGFLELFVDFDSKFTEGHKKKTKFEVKEFENNLELFLSFFFFLHYHVKNS